MKEIKMKVRGKTEEGSEEARQRRKCRWRAEVDQVWSGLCL